MNTTNQLNDSIGVVVGRFQSDHMHPGWCHLIDTVKALHRDVLIVVGVSPFPMPPKNILPYDMRKEMILEQYPDVVVVPHADCRSNADWSQGLDALITKMAGDSGAILYGSRDSFLPSYEGTFPTHYIEQKGDFSATRHREEMVRNPGNSADIRRGILLGYLTRLPVVRPMVDIAVIKGETGEVLLGGKHDDPADTWRFIGGLVDPTDETLERAAKRECIEETSGIEVDDLLYVGSTKTTNWRYGDGADPKSETGITSLFVARYVFGAPRPADDIARLTWIPLKDMSSVLVEEHLPLGAMLQRFLLKQTVVL